MSRRLECWYCAQDGKPGVRPLMGGGDRARCSACERPCCTRHMRVGGLCRQHGTGPTMAEATLGYRRVLGLTRPEPAEVQHGGV